MGWGHSGGRDNPGGTMLVKPRRSQRQAKGADQGQAAEPTWAHTLPAQVGTQMHNLHLTKSFSCHCLAEDNKVLLIQNIGGQPWDDCFSAIYLAAQFASDRSL